MWRTNLRKANEVKLPDRTAKIIARVAPNIFTNYFNNAGGVEVDFPKAALRQLA